MNTGIIALVLNIAVMFAVSAAVRKKQISAAEKAA